MYKRYSEKRGTPFCCVTSNDSIKTFKYLTSTTFPSTMSEEEDLAALVYKTSKKAATARAAAAATAKQKRKQMIASSASTGRRTSPRKRSSVSQDDGASMDRPARKRAASEKRQLARNSGKARVKADWKKYKYECSADGCTNLARKGGVCKKHGAKVKLCSSEGCTNIVIKGGVCIKHGWSKGQAVQQ